MSTDRLKNTNALVIDSADLLDFAQDASTVNKLRSLRINWATGVVTHLDDGLRVLLTKRKWLSSTEGKFVLSAEGLSFLAKFLVDFESLVTKSPEVDGKYVIEEVLASGKNSVAFKARHKFIGRLFVLKFFRPGRGNNVIENLASIGSASGEPFLVHPVDIFPWKINSISGDSVPLHCLVFPFVDGETLESFLRTQKPISPYKSQKIQDYLGEEPFSTDHLVKLLAGRNKRSARYCGWHMVWQLADRTTRHLLELITTIFATAHVDENTTPSMIQPYEQHKAIKQFSENKLKSLNYIPGFVEVEWKKVGLGKQMYEFAAAFGKVAYINLKRGPMRSATNRIRFHEKLAIEIDGEVSLDAESQNILQQLIRYAVIDDTKLVKAFDDQTKKPIYVLNRIYCPALGISFRRDSHWRLSTRRFEQFLLHPMKAVRDSGKLFKEHHIDEQQTLL